MTRFKLQLHSLAKAHEYERKMQFQTEPVLQNRKHFAVGLYDNMKCLGLISIGLSLHCSALELIPKN